MFNENGPGIHDDGEIEKDPQTAEYLQQHIKSQSERGYSSPWHVPSGSEFQREVELHVACKWADGLYEQCGTDIRNIRNNINVTADEFPDCLGEVHGKQIGIEVTELTIDNRERKKYQKEQNYITGLLTEDQKRLEHMPPLFFPVPVQPLGDWSIGKFQKKLKERVQRKDDTARKKLEKGKLMSLHKWFLVIAFDSRFLDVSLENCMEQTKLPRPGYFDDVYVMEGSDPFKVCFI